LILLMLWLYWSGVALLVGAEIDSAIEQAAAEHAAGSESGVPPMATSPRDA
jgi:membrane protein